MELQFYGANCVTLQTKVARILVDDNLASHGAKSVAKAGDIALYTHAHPDSPKDAKIIIDQPGEYEVSGVSIYGIAARSHMDEEGKKSATMYKLLIDDLRVLVTGHIYPDLDDKQLETIGMVDVMIVPVGGNGYTLDPVGALKLIKEVEPKVVVPVHYDDSKLKFEVPQQTLEQALKGLGTEQKEAVDKLKIKSSELSDVMQIVVVSRS